MSMLKMFLIFLKIGTFTLGGGLAMVPLMEEEIVQRNKWLSSNEFIDIIALAQTIPGALAINTATYIGYRIFGFWGAIIACLATMIPSIISILIISIFFIQFKSIKTIESIFKGIRPAIVGLILSAVIKLGKTLPKTLLNLLWVVGSVLLIAVFDVHPVMIIIGSGLLGYKLFKGDISNEHHS